MKAVASARTLAKSVFSINTSIVTEDRAKNGSNGNEDGSDNDRNLNDSKKLVIEGMQIVAITRKQKKVMYVDTALMTEEENGKEGGTNNHNENLDDED